MSSWFKKFDLLTLKNPSFLSSIPKIKLEIPSNPLNSQENSFESFLSPLDFENILQKTLIKLTNILITFFKSELFTHENSEILEFCSESLDFLQIEQRYFRCFWLKKKAQNANFLMNRLLCSFVRFFFFLQQIHKFMLKSNENLAFLEAEISEISLSFDDLFAIFDCFSAIFQQFLQKTMHLKSFFEKEYEFLLSIYLFISNLKTKTIAENRQISQKKFTDKKLENLIYLILDTSKTTILLQKSGFSSEKLFEFEEEFEQDASNYQNFPTIEINEKIIEIPHEILVEKHENTIKIPIFVNKLPKLVKNQSYFFNDIKEELQNESAEDLSEKEPLIHINSSSFPGKNPQNKIRKSLIGDTRKSLIAEAIATNTHKTEELLLKSRFSDHSKENPNNLNEELMKKATLLMKNDDNFHDISLINKSQIIRSFGENVKDFSRYLNILSPTHHVKNPNDKESILKSEFFAKSLNLPSKTMLSTIHPSILYYKNTGNSNENMNNLQEKQENPNFRENINMNLFKPNIKKNDDSYGYFEEIPKNQKFEAINNNLNDELVRFLVDFGKKEIEKPENLEKDGKNLKNTKKDKKINLFVKELEGDSLILLTKNDEETPQHSQRRTLTGKKDLKKQLSFDNDEENDQKHKRKSQKYLTKKLGITEKDLIKIDKNTEIKEKLIYSSFQEKLEENVPIDEDILVTTLSSEVEDYKKNASIATANSFVNSMRNEGNSYNLSKNLSKIFSKKHDENSKFYEKIGKNSNLQGKTKNFQDLKKNYKKNEGILIPFFVKRRGSEVIDDEELMKVNKIAEDVLNDMEVCEEYGEFFIAKRKKEKKIGRNDRNFH